MSAIKILAETKDTVTIKREDLERLMTELEEAEDRAAIADRRAYEKAIGKEAARRDYLTGAEVRRLLEGENPVRVWRDKRGMTQRALAKAADVSPSYLAEIERNRKPGSADALSRLARALRVGVDDLLSEERQRHDQDSGPVFLRWSPHTAGVSESGRSRRPTEQKFATLREAIAEVREQWSSLRHRSPEITDQDRLPIFGTEDLLNEVELRPFNPADAMMMLGISFDDTVVWRDSLNLYPVMMWATTSDGEHIRCHIERSVFFECFDKPHPTAADIKAMFQRHRATFEKAFRNAIHQNLLSSWTEPGAQGREAVLTSSNFHRLTTR